MTIRRAMRGLADASWSSRTFAGAVVILTGAGTWVRISGAFTTPLWNDEARQAVALGGDLELADLARWPLNLRPVLYLLIGKLSILAHDVEWVLRLTSLVPAIASLFVTFALARLLFTSRVSVLYCLFCVSLGPWLVDFAKEYKPYALEHFLVVLQYYLAFRWLRQRSIASLRGLLVLAAVAPLLGFACIFVEPFVFGIVAVDAWRRGDRRVVAATLVTGALTAALFALQYVLFQQHATKMGFRYWDDNFYDTGFQLSRLGGHLHDITGRFAAGAVHGSGLSDLVVAANAALFVIGVAGLAIRRRWQLLTVILGPLLLPLVASFAGRWPYGMVRVNLFMIAPVVLAWTAALDLAITAGSLRRAGLAVAGLLVALQLPLEPRLVLDKQLPAAHMHPVLPPMDMPALLNELFAVEARQLSAGAKVCVHVSAEARPVFLYYARHHGRSAAACSERLQIGRMLSENTRTTMVEMSGALRGDAQPCWLIRSYRYDEQIACRRVLKDGGFRVLAEVEAPGLVATKVERVQSPIIAGRDRSIVLRAEHAVLHGGLWFHGRARIGDAQGLDPWWAGDAIGHWTSRDDAVSWSFEVAAPSELEVLIDQAGGERAGNSEYVVAVGDRQLGGTVQFTGGWRQFATVSIGTVRLAPGRYSASVHVSAMRGDHVMNLRAVILRPRPPEHGELPTTPPSVSGP